VPDEITGDANDLARVFDHVRTERLILRRPNASDTVAFFQVDGNPEANRFNPDGPTPDLAASEKRLQEWWLGQWQDDGYGYWALIAPPDTEVFGFGGVRRIVWRHGYATELARTAISLAQAYLPHLPIIARTRLDSRASQRTAERAGLLRRPDLATGEHIVFALGWQSPESE
jgi:RimJ/RimL family protein N-acetyltransferase